MAGVEPAMTESKSVALTVGRHPIVFAPPHGYGMGLPFEGSGANGEEITQWIVFHVPLRAISSSGPSGIRTPDQPVMSRLL